MSGDDGVARIHLRADRLGDAEHHAPDERPPQRAEPADHDASKANSSWVGPMDGLN